MKAIDLAKILYPALGKQDFIELTCPDNLFIVEKVKCNKEKYFVDNECEECWNKEVSQKRADWLIESKKLRDLMENSYRLIKKEGLVIMQEITMHYNPIDDRFYIYQGTGYEYDTENQKDAFHMYDLLCDIAKKEMRRNI